VGLLLRDGVYQTRIRLGELQPDYWSDEEIIYDLNHAAQDLCSSAGNLTDFRKVPFPEGVQEVALDVAVDQIISVSYYSGQLFQIPALNEAAQVQVANQVTGIPIAWYTKTATRVLSPQGVSGDIMPSSLTPSNQTGQDYVTVLGLWPLPIAPYEINLSFVAFHPFVTKPLDPMAVDARFARTWVAYAVARGKEKESAFEEAQYFQAQYDAGKQEFMPTLARGSSSVIFVDQNPSIYND
jgi:hypothetical protein